MAKKIVIEYYGINPPENSKPFWDNEKNSEDNIITKIDLQASLQKLKQTEREIISLVNQGYSEREISATLDMNNVAVHRIKQRAINKLRRMMNGEDSIRSVFT